MSKKITTNITPKSDLLSKNRTWQYAYENESQYTNDPEWRRKFVNTLFEWADKKTSIEIGSFLREYRIPKETFYSCLDKDYPEVKRAHKEVMGILGYRKKEAALRRGLSELMVLRDLHKYLPEWHEINEYHKKLKEDEAIAVAERLAAKPIIGDPYANLRKEEEEITKRIFEKVKAKLSEEEIATMQAEALKEYKAMKGEV